jgi:UDPglucose 6-dehydrogenase
VVARFGEDLAGRTFAIWGPGLQAQHRRHARGAQPGDHQRAGAPRRAIQAYDPVAMPEARRVLAGTPGLSFVDHQSAALEGADALLIVTEWKEFRNPDFDAHQGHAEAAAGAGRPQPV